MERFKPLLDLGGEPVIARIVRSFIGAGIRDVRVVAGYRKELLVPILTKLGTRVIINDRCAEGMFSSVLAGVKSMEAGVDAFFVLPADIPLVSPSTIRLLAESYGCNPGKILVPRFEGRNGHPPLIDSIFREGIIGYGGNGGLKGALQQFESEMLRVPVWDENILFDIDSPVDYVELQARWRWDISPVDGCETLQYSAMK
jgi:CTP:molybdopterin cytidylyltransferase MocA